MNNSKEFLTEPRRYGVHKGKKKSSSGGVEARSLFEARTQRDRGTRQAKRIFLDSLIQFIIKAAPFPYYVQSFAISAHLWLHVNFIFIFIPEPV